MVHGVAHNCTATFCMAQESLHRRNPHCAWAWACAAVRQRRPQRADLVGTVAETTGLPVLRQLRDRMAEDPEGARILKERPRITVRVVEACFESVCEVWGGGHACVCVCVCKWMRRKTLLTFSAASTASKTSLTAGGPNRMHVRAGQSSLTSRTCSFHGLLDYRKLGHPTESLTSRVWTI